MRKSARPVPGAGALEIEANVSNNKLTFARNPTPRQGRGIFGGERHAIFLIPRSQPIARSVTVALPVRINIGETGLIARDARRKSHLRRLREVFEVGRSRGSR